MRETNCCHLASGARTRVNISRAVLGSDDPSTGEPAGKRSPGSPHLSPTTRSQLPSIEWDDFLGRERQSQLSRLERNGLPTENTIGTRTMISRIQRWFSLADVTLLPAFILWFIWRLQFTARWTWVVFVVWLIASFLIHRDTPKTLGWRADNLWPATKQALFVFGAMFVGLTVSGFALGASQRLLPNVILWHRVYTYFAFCLLQQVALNSLVHNRMLSLMQNEWVAASLTGAIFAVCHWPNPVLVPLTFIGGAAMAWMFGRVRNIIPLAVGQALLGLLLSWAIPVAWHHQMRVGPGYFSALK
jgi:hypothetical protein